MSSFLNKSFIQSKLNSQNIHVDIFDEINSTNEFLKNSASSQQIQICIAESQSAGRGRLEREWHSPFGENIYLSLRYQTNKNFSELGGLSLVVGLSVCEILKNLPDVKVKWPNDVYVDGKKIAGCLIELQADSDVIIGIGLNVNMETANLERAWASIKTVTGQSIDRNKLAVELVQTLIKNIELFEKESLLPFLENFKAYDYLFNKQLTLNCGTKQYQGIARGINNQGHLALFCENTLQYFSSGTVIF